MLSLPPEAPLTEVGRKAKREVFSFGHYDGGRKGGRRAGLSSSLELRVCTGFCGHGYLGKAGAPHRLARGPVLLLKSSE